MKAGDHNHPGAVLLAELVTFASDGFDFAGIDSAGINRLSQQKHHKTNSHCAGNHGDPAASLNTISHNRLRSECEMSDCKPR